MSYNSIHMQHPIAGGYRHSEIRPTTVVELKRLSWRILRGPEVYLNGNTKFQEVPVVAFFFKNGFVNMTTAKDIGFSAQEAGQSIATRLNKVNPQELLSFGIKLMMSGLLKRNWTWLLDPKRKGGGGPMSKHRIIFSKAIIKQAITKYGLNKVCWKLRIDMKVVQFWLDYNN